MIWIFAIVLLYFCLKSIDLERAWGEFLKADPVWLILALFFNTCILGVWASLWSLLIPRNISVSFSRIFQANSFMSTSCNTIPFPGGHAVGVMALARRAEVGHTVALSVLALDQLMEGFAKIFVLTLVAIFVPLPDRMEKAIIAFVVLIGFCLGEVLNMDVLRPEICVHPRTVALCRHIPTVSASWGPPPTSTPLYTSPPSHVDKRHRLAPPPKSVYPPA